MFRVELHTVLFLNTPVLPPFVYFMIANRSPLAVTGRDEVIMSHSRQVFLHAHVLNSSCLSYSLTLMITEIPQCDMIIMFIQSDNTILQDFQKSLCVNAIKSR